jgi:HTH-type transcriptional regulator/antitoxin HigA
MEHKVIKTDAEYKAALERLEMIFDAKPNTPEGDELELLTLLIDNFEKSEFTMEFPDPVEAIKFRMEQMGYRPKDLGLVIGYKSRASEILDKKRKLSLSMIRKISKEMHIPTEVLIQDYLII